jgi:hypothetical protein
MNEQMPSSEFRNQYAKLNEPVYVTVNGHVIGQWLPNGFMSAVVYEFGDDVMDPPREGVLQVETSTRGLTQAKRDDLLRKINRSR